MDPRHPEEAIKRLRELMNQYDKVEGDLAKATTSAQIGQLEREGGLVVQEICLVAPRMHEALIQSSRQRRHDLAHGIVEKPVEKSFYGEVAVHDAKPEEYIEMPKKKATKKKTTKKAKK